MTASIACGACRSSTCVAAFETTARPTSVASTSAASWVITDSPAWYLRADFASRNRNCAPRPARSISHASSTSTSRRVGVPVRFAVLTVRQIASRISSVPTGFSSSGRSLIAYTTRCPSGAVVVGPSNSPLKEPDTYGYSRAARVRPASPVSLQRGGDVGQQRRGTPPGTRVGGDALGPVRGQDRDVEGGGFLAATPRPPPVSTATKVCMNSARRTRASSPSPADRSSGLIRTPGTPGRMIVPPTASARRDVFVFGVDDERLHTQVQVAEQVEFGQVGLAFTGAGEDDGVVVRLRPPVPDHDTRASAG